MKAFSLESRSSSTSSDFETSQESRRYKFIEAQYPLEKTKSQWCVGKITGETKPVKQPYYNFHCDNCVCSITPSFIHHLDTVYNKAVTTKRQQSQWWNKLNYTLFHHKTRKQHLSGEVHKANIACDKQLYNLQHGQAS